MPPALSTRVDPGRSVLPQDYLEALYAGHVRAAHIRSGASLATWLFALAALLVKAIRLHNFIGVTGIERSV